jgi:hypothetical protein
MRLDAANTTNGLVMQWPAYGAGFNVQGVSRLGVDPWVLLGGSTTISNGFYWLTAPLTNSAQTFRLRR